MKDLRKFYIDGQWVDPIQSNDLPVENPANEELVATISLGAAADVNLAVAAARRAFLGFSQTSVDERAIAHLIYTTYVSLQGAPPENYY